MNQKSIKIRKLTVSGALLFVFLTAFVVSPYWLIIGEGFSNILALIVLLVFALFWSHLAAGQITIRFPERKKGYLYLAVVLFVVLINFIPINAEFVFGGDEIHHAFQPIIITSLVSRPIILACFIGALVLFYLLVKGKRLLIYGCALAVAVASAIFFMLLLDQETKNEFLKNLIRYPYFVSIIESIFPLGAKLIGQEHHTFLYRLVPLLSVVFMACHLLSVLKTLNQWHRLLIVVAVVSLPIIYFYSSIMYLEMPAVVLSTIVLLNARRFISDDFTKITHSNYWYALLLVGFTKETSIVFLFVLLLTRVLVQLWRNRKNYFQAKNLVTESKIYFAVLFPLLLYIFFRGNSVRPYIPDTSGIFTLKLYTDFINYLALHIGLWGMVAISGFILLIIKKQYQMVLLVSLYFLFHFLFFALERGGIYIGLSRFNLLFVPVFIFLAVYFFKNTCFKKIGLVVFSLATISLNLALNPIHWDGTRKTSWEIEKTIDLSYPFKQVFKDLKNIQADTVVFLQYRYFEYNRFYEFYGKKYKLKKNIKVVNYKKSTLKTSINELIKNKNYQTIVGQLLPGEQFNPEKHLIEGINYKVYSNRKNCLVLYSKE